MKAFLVSLAVLVVFDAVAWHSAMRTTLVRQAVQAASTIGDLDWTWA
jgi:hypothetical protein